MRLLPVSVTLSLLAVALPSTALAQFGPQTSLGQATSIGDIEPIDIDGDGDLDLAMCDTAIFGLVTMENLGDGVFSTPVALTTTGAFLGSRGLAVGDLDGDGLDDILCPATISNRLSWWRSNGDGTFTTEQVIDAVYPDAIESATGDFDGDGDLDVVCCTYTGASFRFYENLGGGTFAPPSETPTVADELLGITVGFLDTDSFLDVVVCSHRDDQIIWFPGGGDGTFGASQTVATMADGAARAVILDVDSDGQNDVVATLYSANSVAWYPNTGAGFGPPQVLDTASAGPFGIDVGDTDLDGDMDIAVACASGNQSRLYENLGGGTFGPAIVMDGQKWLNWDVALMDMDQDLNLDLVASSNMGTDVTVNENLMTLGAVYCTSLPNSSGAAADLAVTGTPTVSSRKLALTARSLPASSTGYFLGSQTQGSVAMPPNSQGVLCLGGPIGRFVGPGQVQSSGQVRRFTLVLDTAQMPQPSGLVPLIAGTTWNFQAWYTDSVAGVPTSNFTSAVSVSFQ